LFFIERFSIIKNIKMKKTILEISFVLLAVASGTLLSCNNNINKDNKGDERYKENEKTQPDKTDYDRDTIHYDDRNQLDSLEFKTDSV
jgi:hypothetical protein